MLLVHFFDVYRSLTGKSHHVVNIYKCSFAFLLTTCVVNTCCQQCCAGVNAALRIFAFSTGCLLVCDNTPFSFGNFSDVVVMRVIWTSAVVMVNCCWRPSLRDYETGECLVPSRAALQRRKESRDVTKNELGKSGPWSNLIEICQLEDASASSLPV
jgi:hypothetical protein